MSKPCGLVAEEVRPKRIWSAIGSALLSSTLPCVPKRDIKKTTPYYGKSSKKSMRSGSVGRLADPAFCGYRPGGSGEERDLAKLKALVEAE